MSKSKTVSSFWYGDSLTELEVLCIRSFIYFGYQYNLYLYDDVDKVPEGVNIKDASEILDRDELFFYQKGFNSGSVSGFSNIFRYKLLYDRGGTWVDTDLCLLSDSLGFDSHNVFVKEPKIQNKFASCLMHTKEKNRVMKKCIEGFNRYNKDNMKHGETGPELVSESIFKSNLNAMNVELKESGDYFPFNWKEIKRVFYDEIEVKKSWKTIHFWNAWITDKGIDKNQTYPSWSLYERLKNKFMK